MNAYYRLYIKSIIKLTATLVIKSAYTAKSMNDKLMALGQAVDIDNPRSWKYYLNLAGQYHPTQTVMQVTSLDTLETIDFTQANLLIHRATRKEYTYGTRYYSDLVAAYPDQLMLIDGIINPISVDTAISAADHNILSYDKSLVEPNEQHLIPSLQKYIDLYFAQYYNSDYTLFDPYYHVGFLAILYSKIPVEILLLRKAACKTDQAHSYHIRQYLLSNSEIGQEFDLMTKKQKLFFYRNLLYLNRNIGRTETFDLLTQKVLTDRGFGLAGYRLGHDYEHLVRDLVPEVQVDRDTLNGIPPAQGSNKKTVGEVLDMELPLARDNYIVRDDTETHTNNVMQHSLFNNLKTKVLESNVVDRTDSEPFTLTEVLLNHWIYLSHYDRYKSVVAFTNPANGEAYKLSVKNAFIFYLYAFNRSLGVELKKVPVISANRVRRIPLPTKDELMSATDRKKVPEYYIDYILDTQVNIGTYVSIASFREMCQEVQRVMLSHREMRHFNPDYIAEGQLHTIIDRCYQDIRIDLAEEMDYDIWLDTMGIDIKSMGRLEYELIAAEIFKVATGGDLGNTSRLRDIHAAMLRIMGALSSYSIQYIAQINDSPIKIIDGKFPKLTIPQELTEQVTMIENPIPEILDMDAYETERFSVPVNVVKVDMSVRSEAIRQKIPVDVGIRLIGTGTTPHPIEVQVPQVTLRRPEVVDISVLVQDGIAGYLPIPKVDIEDYVDSDVLFGYDSLTEARLRNFLPL